MDSFHYIVCLTCYESKWLLENQVVDFLLEHIGHRIILFHSNVFEDYDAFDAVFKKLLELCKMEEKTT